jgi:hypothetical protein
VSTETRTRTWRLRSKGIDEVTRADDQFAAWETLRARPVEDFGLVVTAEPDESGNPIPVRSSALMFAWGREEDARAAVAVAVAAGLPDTTEQDRRFGEEHA